MAPKMMHAVRVHAPGGREAMRYEEVPVRMPGPGEALVRIEAIGVNFIDVYHRTGLYPVPAPFVLGSEAAGVVEAVGSGMPDDVCVGRRVAYQGVIGAYAEYAIVPGDRLVPLPSGVTTRTAAAVLLQGITAHYLATSTYVLQAGDACLVHAAAGGVGLLLCQIAKLRGAHVIGTVSTPAKAELARGAGADDVIQYTTQDFVAETRRATNDAGVRVVYDSVGRDTFEKSLDCLSPRGLVALFGQSSGPVPPFDLQVLNRKGALYVTRPSVAFYTATREELLQRAGELFAWVERDDVHVRVDREVPLAEAAEAHRALEGRETTGKVLLVPE